MCMPATSSSYDYSPGATGNVSIFHLWTRRRKSNVPVVDSPARAMAAERTPNTVAE